MVHQRFHFSFCFIGHGSITAIMSSRLKNLNIVARHWADGDIKVSKSHSFIWYFRDIFFQPLSCPNNCNLLLFSLKNGKKKCIFIQKWLDHLPLMMSYLATISHQTFANMCLRDIPTATKNGRGRYLGCMGGGGGCVDWVASLFGVI